MRKALLLLLILSLLPSCYHATVETGLPPSPQTLERSFAHGWIYGLVPPSTVETEERCPNGVSRVETQLTFVNQIVNFLTLGIYTPMWIEVTCAADRSAMQGDATAINPAIQAAPSPELPELESLLSLVHQPDM